ncbi:secreted RxLR effector protein 161-like [Solenopsis invicta]|uniref:secreted RxLR effector protein 161-like n=1 Tax=Solenopsis invicta TaxID=13686 RepID=UPI00193E26BD|nr:secreted RxLR effector protein 161-like [Solenopsis invicta]
MFLAIVTRPDIAFVVSHLSKFLNKHNQSHWQAVKRVFAYLIDSANVGIKYRRNKSKNELVGYTDADYASDLETLRSTTGYVFCMTNRPVTWSCQRQKLVTLSTTESEYVAAATAAKELIWSGTHRKLLSGIRCEKATVLHVDNQSKIKLVQNTEFHKRTKHIDIQYHYLREKCDSNEIHIEYVSPKLQKADILTKALSRNRFKELCESLSLVTKKTTY